jgi:choline dehydrogenase
MRPKSKGSVAVRAPNPSAPPSIRFNYLAHPEDRADLRAGVRLTREILAQAALTPVRGEELNPGRHVQSDEEIDAWVRQGVETCYHPVGTCRMGTDPRDSVVDAECRVHGLANLRVVDASVMPAIVSGNTNAPTIMIAEKISDAIRGRRPLPPEAPPIWIHGHWETEQR